MGIIVRSMLPSDYHGLSEAFRRQGRDLGTAALERWFVLARSGEVDLLVVEVASQPAGFARVGWFGAEQAEDLLPEVLDFVVFEPFIGCGVAQALASEAQRRILERTGGLEENALLAIYSQRPVRMQKASFVLDGLFINRQGRFIPSAQAKAEPHLVLSLSGHRLQSQTQP